MQAQAKANQTVEERLAKVIGRNLKRARVLADKTQSQVMLDIWNIEGRKNRISEIENGSRTPSPILLLRLALYYGVSLDFIFGLSHDFERDLHTSRAGNIVQNLRIIGLDIMDNIGRLMADHVSKLPRDDAVVVNDNSKALISFLLNNVDENKVFKSPSKKAEYLARLNAVDQANKEFDYAVARHIRVMRLSVEDHVSRIDPMASSEYLTDKAIDACKPQQATLFDLDVILSQGGDAP